MKFYIERPYASPRMFDVMYGTHKLAGGHEITNVVYFESAAFVNEIAAAVVCTESIIKDAARWCRTLGYKTYSCYEGWKEGDKI
jgi:hypothetical protein